MGIFSALRNPKNSKVNTQVDDRNANGYADATSYYYNEDDGVVGKPYYLNQPKSESEPKPTAPAPSAAPAVQTRLPIGKMIEREEASPARSGPVYKKKPGGEENFVSFDEAYTRLIKKAYRGALDSINSDTYAVLYHYVMEDGTIRYCRAEAVLKATYADWWNGTTDRRYDLGGKFNVGLFLSDLKGAPRSAFRLWPEEESGNRKKVALAGAEAEAVLLLHDALLDSIIEDLKSYAEKHPSSSTEEKPKTRTGFGLPREEESDEAKDGGNNDVQEQLKALTAIMTQLVAVSAAQQQAAASAANPAPESAPADPSASQNANPVPAPAQNPAPNPVPAPAPQNAANAPGALQGVLERLRTSSSAEDTEAVVQKIAGHGQTTTN